MSALRKSAFSSSTRCCSPTDRSSMRGVGIDEEPVLHSQCLDAVARGVEVEHGSAAELVAEDDVLRDGEHRDQLEVLVHHADARGDRVGRARELPWVARRARSRPRRAGRARRSRSSAWSCPAPFSPRRQCTSPRCEGEVDLVVGEEAREALGDRARLEHRDARCGSFAARHGAILAYGDADACRTRRARALCVRGPRFSRAVPCASSGVR